MWEILIIPIIGVGVWIISTLLRGEEDAKKKNGQRGQRKPEKATDLDRFLREVQRRRQEAERQPQRPQPEERREERSASPREEPITVVVAEAQPVVVEAVPPTPVLVAEPIVTPSQLTVHAAPPLPPTQTRPTDHLAGDLPGRPQSRALTGLLELLRSRDGLRMAMILQEVLGPPVARRRVAANPIIPDT